MTPVLSNAPITRLLASVEDAARSDFAFFSMHVMGHRLDDEACGVVQSAIEARSPLVLRVKTPKTLVRCLHAWLLYTRGDIFLDVPAELTQHVSETLPWVFGEPAERAEHPEILSVSLSDAYVSFDWSDGWDTRQTA